MYKNYFTNFNRVPAKVLYVKLKPQTNKRYYVNVKQMT